MTTNPESQKALAGFLHVVFHGAFCFFDGSDDYIYVRVPLVEGVSQEGHEGHEGHGDVSVTEHTYIAGNWLNERTFMSGQFELKGVDKGKAKFDLTKNLHFKGTQPAKSPDGLYAEMKFPRPERIDSLQRGKINAAADFSGTDLEMVKDVREASTVQVFTYKFADHQKLELDPHPRSAFQGEGHLAGGFCSLHLFAEPDAEPSKKHSSHAFQAGLSMYSNAKGGKIDLDIVKPPKIDPIQQHEVPYGTILAELEDLPRRLNTLSALGVRRLQNDDLNGIFEEGAETDLSDPINCMCLVGN